MKELIEEIRKSRLKTEELWLIDYIKDLEEVKSKNYPESIFFKKDSVTVFEHDFKNKVLYCHYDKIWLVFETTFGLNYTEIQSLIKNVVEEHLNWKGFTPQPGIYKNFVSVEEHLNWKGFTPYTSLNSNQRRWKSI